jgi:hypothetical protein
MFLRHLYTTWRIGMSWPRSSDYSEAIEHPLRCFHDAELRRGQAAADGTNSPVVCKGSCADVYDIRCPGDRNRWAVKCYLREVPGLQSHYLGLRAHLARLDLPWLVESQYVHQGIMVRGRWFPIVKLRWIDGVPLNDFVRDYADDPAVLGQLAQLWLGLGRDLRRAAVAHGNLQHDHIRVCRAGLDGALSLRLLDYDGMFVPALAGNTPEEAGHVNYEHPQRIWQKSYDAEMDRFAELVIYTALQALSAGGRALWQRYDIGCNLLFREGDFQEPATSAVFHELWRMNDEPTRALAGHLILASQGPLAAVPRLEELLLRMADRRANSETGLPLTAAQIERIEALLGSDRPAEMHKRARVMAPATLDAESATVATDEFELVVDSDPDVVLPAPPLATAPIAAGPPPLVRTPMPISAQPDYDPAACDYHFDAWMPERVAVMKLQGFCDSFFGEVITSVPGLVRVHLLDPLGRPQPRENSGLLTWLGLGEKTPSGPRVVSIVELYMEHKETEFQHLLAMTIRVKHGNEPSAGDKLNWQRYCDQIFCQLRGFLMGKS